LTELSPRVGGSLFTGRDTVAVIEQRAQ